MFSRLQAVKVFDGSTGRQMSALDIRRPADAISFFADDPQTVLVSSSAGLWCFDLRTEQKTHQLFLDGFKIGAVAADDWRVVRSLRSKSTRRLCYVQNQPADCAMRTRSAAGPLWRRIGQLFTC